MMTTNGSDSVSVILRYNSARVTSEDTYFEPGLTKRELFAALAMQAMLSSRHVTDTFHLDGLIVVATTAVRAADALIEVLNEEVAE